MMITLKENGASSTSQPIRKSRRRKRRISEYENCLDSNNNTINRSYSTIAYDYQHHHHSWEKPNYATFNYPPYSIGTMSSTGGLSSLATTNKNHSSFDPTHSTFYRRHSKFIRIISFLIPFLIS